MKIYRISKKKVSTLDFLCKFNQFLLKKTRDENWNWNFKIENKISTFLDLLCPFFTFKLAKIGKMQIHFRTNLSKGNYLTINIFWNLFQMGDPHAVPVLKSVLIDATREPIVRHEAAEALAAIADPQVLPLLREYVSDPVQVITSYDTFNKHDLIRKVVLYKSGPWPRSHPPKNLASANLGRNDLKIHQNDWTTIVQQCQKV